MIRYSPLRTAALFVGALLSLPACAWGDRGHEVTAIIAYRHLSAAARLVLQRMLAADNDTLTASDLASRSTWADKYRGTHRETASWHFIDVEIDRPDPIGACFGFPALAPGVLASQGPADDCVVNKIDEFLKELKDHSTPDSERRLALKFLIHFVGDLHQPLHASDNHDRGGNCVTLSSSPDGIANLHAFWDVTVVNALGRSATEIADRLDGPNGKETRGMSAGNPRRWAKETFELSRRDVYRLPARPTCQAPGAIELPAGYERQAELDAALQLKRAGLRLAALLNRALAS